MGDSLIDSRSRRKDARLKSRRCRHAQRGQAIHGAESPQAGARSSCARHPVPPHCDRQADTRRRQRDPRQAAPHPPRLGIYKMNQTWLGSSAWTRITGCALSGVAYLYFGSYLVAPLFGWHLESASLAAAFAGMPFIVNGGIKFLLGFPFAMHFFNGVKHLVLDTGRGFAKASVVRVETAAWTFGILGGLFLAFGL